MAASRPELTRQNAPRATRLGVLAILGPISAFSVMNSIVKLSPEPSATGVTTRAAMTVTAVM